MQTFDASSMIYAWDNYPPEQFPPLWRWMSAQIGAGTFDMPQVAFEEVERHAPDCAEWLRDQNINRIGMSNSIMQEALRIKTLLQIEGDKYHPKGVSENDLLIIATASVQELIVVSNEGRQNQFPIVLAKARIPAVCGRDEVDVPCINFIELIRESGEVFEGSGP